MKKAITILRIAYWIGIIADGFVAVKLLIMPYQSDLAFKPEMETVSSLMIGWTMLLFWADRKPIARRTVLLLTIIMMSIGQMTYLAAVFLKKITITEAMQNGIPPLIIMMLFILAYVYSEVELKKGIKTSKSILEE